MLFLCVALASPAQIAIAHISDTHLGLKRALEAASNLLARHWHSGMVFRADGITHHLAPAASWSPFGSPLGFAMHTISPSGDLKTEFVNLR